MGEQLSHIPFRATQFMPRDIVTERRADGTILLSTRVEPLMEERIFPAYLRHFARTTPDAPFLSARAKDREPWRTLTYGEALDLVNRLTQGLLDRTDGSGRPLAILSGNSIEHALLMLAAMQAGIPVAPLAPGYSLLSKDFAKLKMVLGLLEPEFLFVQHTAPFAKAIDAVASADRKLIALDRDPDHAHVIGFDDLARTEMTDAVEQSVAALDPDQIAKIMMTSGSTGSPKGVIHTHRGLCATTETSAQTFGMTSERTAVRLDWLPWNHVAGAVSFATVLATGGHHYIDNGKPTPDGVEESIANLKEVMPTLYGNVPIGYLALVTALEADADFSRRFFSSVEYLGYSGARLPDDLCRRIQELSIAATGCRTPISSAFGSTESGPTGAFVYWATERTGLIGLPMPGVVLKLVPFDGERYELRLKSPGVMNGYYKDPARTSEAFDEEGYYSFADLVTFADPDDVNEGLVFAGRMAEEFKLQTGIFVRAGALRAEVINATAPLLQAAVICGQDEAFVGLLAWVNVPAARAMFGLPDAGLAELARDPRVADAVARGLAAHNAANPASSTRIARFMLLDRAPDADKGEITDKGEINQRVVQKERVAEVAALFSDQPPETVHSVPALSSAK